MSKLFTAVLITGIAALVAITATVLGLAWMQGGKKAWRRAKWVDPVRDAPNGTTYQTFASNVLKADVSYLIYLPPGYEEGTKRYPVIYWLHGLGNYQRAGAETFVPYVDSAIRSGAMPPVIVVLVNGLANSYYCDWANGERPMESVIIQDLIPHVDETYRTLKQREGRMIQGYSMGGYGAARFAFKYPELFGSAVIDAGAFRDVATMTGPDYADTFKDAFGEVDRFHAEDPFQIVQKNASNIRGKKMNIRIAVGKDDDFLAKSQELHELLQRLQIAHEYEVVPDVGHGGLVYYKKLGVKGLPFHRRVFESLETGK
jgi:endo-1,4-beta-xylanase